MTLPVAPNTITPLPTPPTTSDPTTFDSRADATLLAQQDMVPQQNSANATTYNNAVVAYDSAQIAAPAALAAQAAALAAQVAAGLPPLPGAGQLLRTSGVTNILTGATTLVANIPYECDTSAAGFTVTLPVTLNVGDWFMLSDHTGTFASKNLTVARNGHKIQSLTEDLVLDINNASVLLVYIDTVKGMAIK